MASDWSQPIKDTYPLGLFKERIFEILDPGRWEDCLTYYTNRF